MIVSVHKSEIPLSVGFPSLGTCGTRHVPPAPNEGKPFPAPLTLWAVQPLSLVSFLHLYLFLCMIINSEEIYVRDNLFLSYLSLPCQLITVDSSNNCFLSQLLNFDLIQSSRLRNSSHGRKMELFCCHRKWFIFFSSWQ